MQEERRKKEEEAERAKTAEAKRMKGVWRDQWRRWKRNNLPPEPTPSKGALRVGIRLPDGRRLIRQFSPTDTVELLYSFVDVQLLSNDNSGDADIPPPPDYVPEFEFTVATAYPRHEVPVQPTSKLLADIDALKGGANLVVEMKAGTDAAEGASSDDDEDDEDDE